MKRKIFAIILAITCVAMSPASVDAKESAQKVSKETIEEMSNEMIQVMSSTSRTFYGSSYDEDIWSVNCICSVSGTSVYASTSLSDITVVIYSNSYHENSSATKNGGSGSSARGSASTSYSASSSIYYTGQIHQVPSLDYEIGICLFKY